MEATLKVITNKPQKLRKAISKRKKNLLSLRFFLTLASNRSSIFGPRIPVLPYPIE